MFACHVTRQVLGDQHVSSVVFTVLGLQYVAVYSHLEAYLHTMQIIQRHTEDMRALVHLIQSLVMLHAQADNQLLL